MCDYSYRTSSIEMATLCENLGASKMRRVLANEIMGDTSGSANVKDLTLQAQDKIVIKPNAGSGSNATKIVQVIGDTNITGTLTVGSFSFSGDAKVQDVKFDGSAMSTTNNTLSLAGNQNVRVEDVVFTDNQMAPATDADLVLSAGATSSVMVEGVKVTDNTVSTASGDLSLTAQSGTVQVESVTFADGVVNTSSGPLELTSAAGTVQIEDVIFTNSALTVDGDANISLTAGATSSVVLENVKVTDNAIDTTSGALTLASAAGTVQVENVIFTDSALTASSDANISITAGATSSVVLENVKVTDNAIDTTSGGLTLASAAGTVQVENVVFTDAALTVASGDISITAGSGAFLNLENVTINDSAISTSADGLTLSSAAGTVQVENVIFTDSALTASSDADISITAGATHSVLVEGVKVTDNTVSTSSGSLSLTSAAGTVAVEEVTFTDSALTTANNVLSLDAAVSVDLKKDLVLTSTAGGSGKITTSAGQLELASASGVVKISGNLEVNGTLNSINTTETNVEVVDKTMTLAFVEGGSASNVNANGGGIFMDGNSSFSDRAISWHMGAGETSQDKGDNTGSYWHIEGGQLLFSRTIALADRYAPGTNVLLSSLASGADDTRWEFTSGTTSEVGAKVMTLNGGATVANGVLKVNDSGSQSASCATSMPNGSFTIIAKVTPKADLSSSSANGVVLLSYAGPSSTVTVSVTDGGRLQLKYEYPGFADMNNSAAGLLSTETFTIAVVRESVTGLLSLYLNGVMVAASGASVDVGASPTLTLGPGKNQAGYSVWFDDVRVNSAAITAANTQLYGYKEMYAEDQIVTYGFRIGNDESMQLVKVRGSGSHSRVCMKPAPNTITDSNTMGEIGSTGLDVVSESLN
eukprot:jgi/Mesvir1/26569/Mv25607-RA.1